MDARERRRAIMGVLERAKDPVSGSALAREVGVIHQAESEKKKQEEAAAENHRLRRIVCQYLFQICPSQSKFRPVEFPHNC